MSLFVLSTPPNPILSFSLPSPPLLPRPITITNLPSLPFPPLRLRSPLPLRPLLPSPRVTFDIPIKIDDDDYQRYLDTEPWKGAIVYRRDATVSHLEFSTSLNRLAIGWLASRVSAERAAQMGLTLSDDLNWGSDDEDEDEDEDEDVDEGEDSDGGFRGGLNGEDVALEGKDKDGNPVYLTADELRNATISVKYDNGEFNFDDFDDDEEEEEDEDDEEGEEFMDTPVFVSVDVTRRRGRIRLDGIIRTVITLDCNRCFASAAQPVYSNFSFLLSEQPIGESPSEDDGTLEEMFDEGKTHKNMVEMEGAHGDEDRDIGWDDRLHFPAGEREIDISKQVRDIIHLEVNMNVVCSANCKGVCLQCGSNLNLVKCTCVKAKGREASRGASGNYGPLRDLRKKMGNNLG